MFVLLPTRPDGRKAARPAAPCRTGSEPSPSPCRRASSPGAAEARTERPPRRHQHRRGLRSPRTPRPVPWRPSATPRFREPTGDRQARHALPRHGRPRARDGPAPTANRRRARRVRMGLRGRRRRRAGAGPPAGGRRDRTGSRPLAPALQVGPDRQPAAPGRKAEPGRNASHRQRAARAAPGYGRLREGTDRRRRARAPDRGALPSPHTRPAFPTTNHNAGPRAGGGSSDQ